MPLYARSGKWQATIRRRGFPEVCKIFEFKADAKVWLEDQRTQMNKGLWVSTKEAEAWTVEECLDRFIEEYLPSLKHPEREVSRIRRIKQYPISKKIMAHVRSKDLADFKQTREAEGRKPDTIRLDFSIFSRLFNYARDNWGMESLINPVEHATKPKVSKLGRTRRLEGDEEERLLANASSNFALILQLALATAMRRSEIMGLDWKRVDLTNKKIFIPKTKNTRARTVPLSPGALTILENLPRNTDGRVFGFNKDYPTTEMSETRRKAGIVDLRFHDLRHEATSRLFEFTDLTDAEIMAITGHTDAQMLLRYTHLRTARLADRLAGAKRGA